MAAVSSVTPFPTAPKSFTFFQLAKGPEKLSLRGPAVQGTADSAEPRIRNSATIARSLENMEIPISTDKFLCSFAFSSYNRGMFISPHSFGYRSSDRDGIAAGP